MRTSTWVLDRVPSASDVAAAVRAAADRVRRGRTGACADHPRRRAGSDCGRPAGRLVSEKRAGDLQGDGIGSGSPLLVTPVQVSLLTRHGLARFSSPSIENKGKGRTDARVSGGSRPAAGEVARQCRCQGCCVLEARDAGARRRRSSVRQRVARSSQIVQRCAISWLRGRRRRVQPRPAAPPSVSARFCQSTSGTSHARLLSLTQARVGDGLGPHPRNQADTQRRAATKLLRCQLPTAVAPAAVFAQAASRKLASAVQLISMSRAGERGGRAAINRR